MYLNDKRHVEFGIFRFLPFNENDDLFIRHVTMTADLCLCQKPITSNKNVLLIKLRFYLHVM